MSEAAMTICPDCGANYQCGEEQQGKLLHCKCGRYLVAGGQNKKTEVVKAPVAATPQSMVPRVQPKSEGTVYQEPSAVKPPSAGTSKNMLMLGGTIAALAMAALAVLLFRPPQASSSAKPPQVVASAAAPCTEAPVRLENGTSLAHSLLGNGMGTLEIANNTDSDVAVRVIGAQNLTVAWIYVQQGQSATVNEIPLGTHRLMVASGSDWDANKLAFKCKESYAQFNEPLQFTERQEDDRTSHSSRKVTLGKQTEIAITRADFFKGYLGTTS